MNIKPLVSLVIVDYCKGARVVENVESALRQQGEFDLEIVVLDNSCDSNNADAFVTIEHYSNVKIIINTTNTGYVEATNRGVAETKGEFVFIVNPDIVWLDKSTIEQSIRTLQSDANIGIIGTKQVNDDGTTPETVRSFPNILAQIARRTFLRRVSYFSRVVENYEMSGFDYNKDSDVEWVQSSFMVVKRSLWLEIGGLDPRFYLFMADPDICYKCWDAGYRVRYISSIEVGADGKRCSAGGLLQFFENKVLRLHFKDALAYELKYFLKKVPINKLYKSKLR